MEPITAPVAVAHVPSNTNMKNAFKELDKRIDELFHYYQKNMNFVIEDEPFKSFHLIYTQRLLHVKVLMENVDQQATLCFQLAVMKNKEAVEKCRSTLLTQYKAFIPIVEEQVKQNWIWPMNPEVMMGLLQIQKEIRKSAEKAIESFNNIVKKSMTLVSIK